MNRAFGKYIESANSREKYYTQPERINTTYVGKPDREIWTAFKSGNRSAFIYIYNTYFDELYSYGRQFTGDLELIKDAIQEVFIRLNESKTHLSDTDSIKFYLYKAIKREVVFMLQQYRRSADKHAALNGQGFEYEISFEEALINRQISEEKIKKIRDAANNLNDKQREIIFYHFFEGFSIKQIRELMKFGSVQATHNLLKRALNQLRSVLGVYILFFLILR